MRKQVGIKLEESDLERWDEFAQAQGWSRTTLIETAVERLMGTGEAPPPKAPESRPPESDSKHLARPGIRRAFICQHKGRDGQLDCFRRTFVPDTEPAEFVPECPEHGPMVRQANRPYRGQSTEPSPAQGWPEAKV